MSAEKMIAKFKCDTVTKNTAGYEVNLSPVTSGSKENEEFFRWTPGGHLSLATLNQRAGVLFEPGDEYEIHIIPAKVDDET